MPLRRFIIFWLLDYVVATMVVFVLSSAGPSLFGIRQFAYLSLFYIPVGSMFFSWLAYRGVEKEVAHRLLVAGVWTGLAAVVDVSVSAVASHINIFAYFFSPLVIAIYGLKFLSVFAGAYLGLSPSAELVAAERLSLRSKRALPLSSDLLHPEQE